MGGAVVSRQVQQPAAQPRTDPKWLEKKIAINMRKTRDEYVDANLLDPQSAALVKNQLRKGAEYLGYDAELSKVAKANVPEDVIYHHIAPFLRNHNSMNNPTNIVPPNAFTYIAGKSPTQWMIANNP